MFEYTVEGFKEAKKYLDYHGIEYSAHQSGYEVVQTANKYQDKVLKAYMEVSDKYFNAMAELAKS
jgi:hypothetical protein